MTRDSNVWWWVMGGAIVTGLASHMNLVDGVIPDPWEQFTHALIELLAFLVTTAAGVARMSPLPISPEGRQEAIAKQSESTDTAAQAAAVASVASDEAAKSAAVAASAAKVAESESTKAADPVDQ